MKETKTIEKQKVIASWSLACNIECPYCDGWIDLIEDMEEWYSQLPDPCKSEKDLDIEFECPHCEEIFIINETQF